MEKNRLTRKTPGSNDFDIGLEAVEGELKPNLVIALAGASMRNETGKQSNQDGGMRFDQERRTRNPPLRQPRSCLEQ